MISQAVKEALQRFVPVENILYKEPLKEHTTFRVGGVADCMVEIADAGQLAPSLRIFPRWKSLILSWVTAAIFWLVIRGTEG